MRWHDIALGWGVLEFDHGSPFPTSNEVPKPEAGLELLVFWGGGEPTRAVWRWSRSGRVAGWAAVGEA